jgi:hypothetical protein
MNTHYLGGGSGGSLGGDNFLSTFMAFLILIYLGYGQGLPPCPQQPYVPPVRYLGGPSGDVQSIVPRFPLQQPQRSTMQRPTSSDANSTITSYLMQFMVVCLFIFVYPNKNEYNFVRKMTGNSVKRQLRASSRS